MSHPSDDGGGVYTADGETVHNRICSFNCSTVSNGQYCYSRSSQGSFKNFVIQSSLSRSFENSFGAAPTLLLYGNQNLTKTNISYFRTVEICGYQLQEGETESMSAYNSIINNTSTDNNCIRNQFFPIVSIIHCNIINNSVKDRIFSNYRCFPLIIDACNIIDNSGFYTFYVEDFGRTQVNNCFLRNEGSTCGVISIENTLAVETNNEINHLSTAFCYTLRGLKHRSPFKDIRCLRSIHFYIFVILKQK